MRWSYGPGPWEWHSQFLLFTSSLLWLKEEEGTRIGKVAESKCLLFGRNVLEVPFGHLVQSPWWGSTSQRALQVPSCPVASFRTSVIGCSSPYEGGPSVMCNSPCNSLPVELKPFANKLLMLTLILLLGNWNRGSYCSEQLLFVELIHLFPSCWNDCILLK